MVSMSALTIGKKKDEAILFKDNWVEIRTLPNIKIFKLSIGMD